MFGIKTFRGRTRNYIRRRSLSRKAQRILKRYPGYREPIRQFKNRAVKAKSWRGVVATSILPKMPRREVFTAQDDELNWYNKKRNIGGLSQYEDRRSYQPIRTIRPAKTAVGVRTKLKEVRVKQTKVSPKKKSLIAFSAPSRVVICAQRKMRKEVLHAKRKTGAGHGRQKKPRYNEFSSVVCL